MTKEEILSLIDTEMGKAVMTVSEILGKRNPVFNDLCKEFISPPSNFSTEKFRNRFKMFVQMNEEITSSIDVSPKIYTDKKIPNNLLDKMQHLISRDEMQEAIKLLLKVSDSLNPKTKMEISILSGQFEDLSRDNRMGVLSSGEADRKTNKIRYNLLEIVGTL